MLFGTLTATMTATALSAIALPAQAQDVKCELTKVTGDVWRFQNNFNFSTVVVTAGGVVVTDPINAEVATWLETGVVQ